MERTRNDRIWKQDSARYLETEPQPERIGVTMDIYLWTGVPLDTFESIKKEGGRYVIAGDTKDFILLFCRLSHSLRTARTDLFRCIWFESRPVC